MLTYRHHWSHLVGPRQTLAVSLVVCCDVSQSPLHPHPHHTSLHRASFQATSAAQMTPTTRHCLEPRILRNCTASHPTHHTVFIVFKTASSASTAEIVQVGGHYTIQGH